MDRITLREGEAQTSMLEPKTHRDFQETIPENRRAEAAICRAILHHHLPPVIIPWLGQAAVTTALT